MHLLKPKTTLRGRVALAAAGVAGAVGLLASAGAALVVQYQHRAFGDHRLLESAQLLANELVVQEAVATRQASEENEELRSFGMQLALFEANRLLGGASDLSSTLGCLTIENKRLCGVNAGSRRVVVAGPEERISISIMMLSILLTATISGLLGAAASLAVAKWALQPLTSLQQRLSSVDLDGSLDLGPRAGTVEVDAFRQALQSLFQRLQESVDHARVFAAGAAHELRTPLATLLVELELAKANASGASLESLGRAGRTVQRLSILIDRLLSLASNAQTHSLRETLACEDLAREVVGNRSEAERARIVIHIDDPGMTRGDSLLLSSVIDNLIDNALKFSSESVELRVTTEGQSVQLQVRDFGPGIPSTQVDALLRPFVRGATSERGHGLGLAIVNHAIELHRGSLHIDGSAVFVRLPQWTADDHLGTRTALLESNRP